MNFNPLMHDSETRNALRGIYPILNVTPRTEIEELLGWALNLPDAGIRMIQIRAKMFPDDVLPGVLDELVGNLRGAGLMVVLNDFVELVGITGAEGVHVGIEDYPVFNARQMLGPRAIVGATCRNFTEALMVIGQGATYVALGSIYESPTKKGPPVIGLDGLKQAVDEIKKEGPPRPGWGRFDSTPVVAIGGITLERLREVHDSGASMAAVIGAIQDADAPVEAARALVDEWNRLDSA
jgi:thiamine-phosphate pyrophosphorylase